MYLIKINVDKLMEIKMLILIIVTISQKFNPLSGLGQRLVEYQSMSKFFYSPTDAQ
jgi:hypothetical protein